MAAACTSARCASLPAWLPPPFLQVVHGHYQGTYGDCQKCQLGLSLAHLQIWRQMIAAGIPRAFVFEDDVVFHQDFSTLFPQYWRQVPEDALVVWVGYSRTDQHFYCRWARLAVEAGQQAGLAAQQAAVRCWRAAGATSGVRLVMPAAAASCQGAGAGAAEQSSAAWLAMPAMFGTPCLAHHVCILLTIAPPIARAAATLQENDRPGRDGAAGGAGGRGRAVDDARAHRDAGGRSAAGARHVGAAARPRVIPRRALPAGPGAGAGSDCG